MKTRFKIKKLFGDKDGKYKNENDIKKNIITIRNQEKTFKILSPEFTELISTYLGA